MSKMLNTAQAAIEWVTDTRQRAARLDDEADAPVGTAHLGHR